MNIINNFIQKLSSLNQEPQKIGLSQFTTVDIQEKKDTPSLKKKDIKLSDLMRRSN